MNKKVILVGAMLIVGSTLLAQQNETQLEEVTLTSKTTKKFYESGKNVTLLTKEDLQKYQGQSLPDVLSQVSGVQISGNFNNATEPKFAKIRGGKSSNILVLVDGIPLKDVTGNDYVATDLRLLSLENVESIEILNGASSVLYGSNATVSVLNIKTKVNSNKKIAGELGLKGGSFGTFGQNLGVRGKINSFRYQIQGSNEKSDGISAAKGDDTFDKDGWEKQNVNATIGYEKNNLSVSANAGFNHQVFDYDTSAFVDGKLRSDDEQFFAGVNGKYSYNKGSLVLNTRYSTTDRLTKDWVNEGYQDQYSYKGNSTFAELFNSYTFNPFVELIAGVQYEKQALGTQSLPWGGTSMEDGLLKKDTFIETYDIFATAKLSYQNLHLDAGIRMTNHSKFKDHYVYNINPYYLKETDSWYGKIGYSFATAFISPTLYQNFGSLPWVLPNFDLKPETNESHEIDFSIGKKDRSINFYASVYQRSEKDAFVYQLNPDYTGIFVNLDQNKTKGFEVGADYQIQKWVKVGANFSFVEKEKEATMVRVPKQRVNSYVEIKPFETTRFVVSHTFVGKMNDAYYDANSYQTMNVINKSYHLFNLNVNQKITSNLDAYLNIGNVLNTSYVDVAGYTTKPRNYMIGANYSF